MTSSSGPYLYFVRAWRTQKVTQWAPIKGVLQEHNIKDTELGQLTANLPFIEPAPSFWSMNGAYAASPMGRNGQNPPKTFAILKIPVALVADLTPDQVQELANELDNYNLLKRLVWNSRNLHSIATINHLPTDPAGARGFYRNGSSFFWTLKSYARSNTPAYTVGHIHAQRKQVSQPAPMPGAASSSRPVSPAPAPASNPPPATPTPAPPASPTRNFKLHRQLGIKGNTPSPDALKQLRRIWNAQKKTGDAAAEKPDPKPDEPSNN